METFFRFVGLLWGQSAGENLWKKAVTNIAKFVEWRSIDAPNLLASITHGQVYFSGRKTCFISSYHHIFVHVHIPIWAYITHMYIYLMVILICITFYSSYHIQKFSRFCCVDLSTSVNVAYDFSSASKAILKIIDKLITWITVNK